MASAQKRESDSGSWASKVTWMVRLMPVILPGATDNGHRCASRHGSTGGEPSAVVDHECREPGAGVDVELAVDVGEVRVDGAGGDVELLGDLAAGQPVRHPLGDLALGGRERVEHRRSCGC